MNSIDELGHRLEAGAAHDLTRSRRRTRLALGATTPVLVGGLIVGLTVVAGGRDAPQRVARSTTQADTTLDIGTAPTTLADVAPSSASTTVADAPSTPPATHASGPTQHTASSQPASLRLGLALDNASNHDSGRFELTARLAAGETALAPDSDATYTSAGVYDGPLHAPVWGGEIQPNIVDTSTGTYYAPNLHRFGSGEVIQADDDSIAVSSPDPMELRPLPCIDTPLVAGLARGGDDSTATTSLHDDTILAELGVQLGSADVTSLGTQVVNDTMATGYRAVVDLSGELSLSNTILASQISLGRDFLGAEAFAQMTLEAWLVGNDLTRLRLESNALEVQIDLTDLGATFDELQIPDAADVTDISTLSQACNDLDGFEGLSTMHGFVGNDPGLGTLTSARYDRGTLVLQGDAGTRLVALAL